jgi:hypothetical protein
LAPLLLGAPGKESSNSGKEREMAGVEEVIDRAKKELAMRPILPLGQTVPFGAIGTIDDNGAFRYWGSSKSLLGESAGRPLPDSKARPDFGATSGDDVSVGFKARGEASSLFPNLPKAKARVEVSFAKKNSCLISARTITVKTLAEPHKLAEAIKRRYLDGAWDADYIVVYQLGWAGEYLGISADADDTNVALSAKASINQQPVTADLAGNFSVSAHSKAITRQDAKNALVFFNAYRIHRRWFVFWKKSVGVRPAALGEEPNVEMFEEV